MTAHRMISNVDSVPAAACSVQRRKIRVKLHQILLSPLTLLLLLLPRCLSLSMPSTVDSSSARWLADCLLCLCESVACRPEFALQQSLCFNSLRSLSLSPSRCVHLNSLSAANLSHLCTCSRHSPAASSIVILDPQQQPHPHPRCSIASFCDRAIIAPVPS